MKARFTYINNEDAQGEVLLDWEMTESELDCTNAEKRHFISMFRRWFVVHEGEFIQVQMFSVYGSLCKAMVTVRTEGDIPMSYAGFVELVEG